MCNTNIDIDISNKSDAELHDMLESYSHKIEVFKQNYLNELRQARDGEDPLIQELGNMVFNRQRIAEKLNL